MFVPRRPLASTRCDALNVGGNLPADYQAASVTKWFAEDGSSGSKSRQRKVGSRSKEKIMSVLVKDQPTQRCARTMTPRSSHGLGNDSNLNNNIYTRDALGGIGNYPGGINTGILPAIPSDGQLPDKAPSSNAATGASAAGVRALASQVLTFYFRAPAKAFFRTRVDYLAYARALQEQQAMLLSQLHVPSQVLTTAARAGAPTVVSQIWEWVRVRARATTPGVIASAVKHYGWRVVPDQVLPPLIANVTVGAVLYTSYLHILGHLHPESRLASKRVYPPPSPLETFTAGFLAGTLQSVIAAPLDAVQARYDIGQYAGTSTTPASGNSSAVRPKSMWVFSFEKIKEIGVRGIFAGWTLSFLKDSLGSAIFFSTFEYLKAQGYYNFVSWYYGSLNKESIILLSEKQPSSESGREDSDDPRMPAIIRPHYAIEPAFLLLAGMGASTLQQFILHPLTIIQAQHWERLEKIDAQARKLKEIDKERLLPPAEERARFRWRMMKTYYNAYQETWASCAADAKGAGMNMPNWLYRGFWWNTIRQVPSTSAGLIIFELVRRKYGFGGEQVRINRDGYDILLK
ncbi:mitochondrial carrier [Neurospora intermedia]|uniref:Mitochondrial carrier n=1 Tax=Neurospora intermedia TaxID=5142 RepID=A0ABR3D6G3_NEUIN